jgi:hypothetical protein
MKTFLSVLLLLSVAMACSNNCYDCDPAGTICFACAEGFELSVMNTCVDSNTIPKCDLYGPANQCFACQATFTINNGQCLKDYSACLAYDPSDDSKCITCGFGTTLKNNACAGPINCNNTVNGACNSCITGFTLSKGACTDTSGNCATVGSNGICSTCKTGFNLVGYSCLPSNVTVYGCYVFDASGTCQLCKAGYNIYQGNCLLPSQIQQILQGITQLSTILTQRNTVSVTTTTTTTTTTTSANGGDFGSSGFGSGFGGFGGFGGDNSSLFGASGSSFGGSGGSFGASSSSFGGSSFGGDGGFGGSGGSFGFGGQSNAPPIANCQSYDPSNPSICLACISGYFLEGGACVQVSIFCASYNLQTGVCLTCNFGLHLQNGQCNDPNCLAQTVAGCSFCNEGYALTANSFCQKLPPNCLSVDASFFCTKCARGNQLSNGACVSSLTTVTTTTTSTSTTITIPFCAAQSGLICTQCLFGYQISNNQCVVVLIANCHTPDQARPGNCLTCNSGFTLNNGACVQTQAPSTPFCQSYNLLTGLCVECISMYTLSASLCVATSSFTSSSSSTSTSTSYGGSVIISGGSNRDPNCAKYNNGSICAQCSNRYYYGSSSLCVPVNPLCNNYNSNGACLSCYPGYSLAGSNCIVSKQTDPFCKSYSQGGVCVQCYTGYYYNQVQSFCQGLNPLCKTSNLVDGTCLTCYPGYSLNAGYCAVSFQDPNCQKWDSSKGVCTACSSRFYIDGSGKCKQVSPLCKTSDGNTGACLSCYPGYVLSGLTCSIGGAGNSDVNCQNFNNGVCQKCYSGYFLDFSGKCKQNNPLCKTSDQASGNCLTCYPGYSVVAGNCTLSSSSTTSLDPNCKGTNQNGVCNGCYSGYFLTPGMNCQKTDPLCKTLTAAFSACASCYDGYSLSGAQCVLSSQAASPNSDPYCVKLQGGNCIACSSGFYLPPSGICAALNTLCKDSDLTNGNCLSCYPGYSLSANTCIVAAAVTIPYCSQVVGNNCVACINGYYVSSGACALVNLLCATYDPNNGNCLSCGPGYVFQAGQCIMPSLGIDPSCTWYSNSYCTQCSTGFALASYWCNPIDPSCTQYNPATSTCLACSQGKTPQGASCV